MPNLNKVFLIGNLTRDPELRYLPSNIPVVNVGLATNRRFKNSQGEQQEDVTFVDCEAFGRTAEIINQYMRKGRPLFIEGRLKFDQWQDRDGNNRSKLKVVVENFQFVDGRGSENADGGDAGQNQGRSNYQRSSNSGSDTTAQHGSNTTHQAVEEENIPF